MYTNIESHRTPETNVMLYVNYTSIKKEKKKERKEEEANATTLETEAFVMVWYREPSTDEITVQSAPNNIIQNKKYFSSSSEIKTMHTLSHFLS